MFRGPVMRTIGTIPITPGAVTLPVARHLSWRHAQAGRVRLPADRGRGGGDRRIVARGEPVYGVDTGFGKLASVRIPAADLARLQRNIVLSHAAGTGEPVEKPIVRLMIALKMANLGQGVSGVRLETVRMLETMLRHDIIPVIPAQGSVGASGDLAPLAHMAAAMIGEGDVFTPTGRRHASEALFLANIEPLELGPKEGLALLNGTQFSTAHALAALFEAERLHQCALVTGALATEAAKGSDTPFDPRIQSCAGTAARSRRPTRCGS